MINYHRSIERFISFYKCFKIKLSKCRKRRRRENDEMFDQLKVHPVSSIFYQSLFFRPSPTLKSNFIDETRPTLYSEEQIYRFRFQDVSRILLETLFCLLYKRYRPFHFKTCVL